MALERKIISSAPENSETPLESVAGWVTPNQLFFVRNHFEPPLIDSTRWELSIGGLVERPARWSFTELARLTQHTVFATVECAGNGRSFLPVPHAGVQWGAGAIGQAEWSGVRLVELLDLAGVKPEVREIVFEGADHGIEPDHPAPMAFSRSLPLAKAADKDTLIALRMNGEWLEPNHGAPARLLVPGWYGVASVKWLQSIRAIDNAYPGYFQTVKYSVDRPGPSGRQRVPLGPGAVKSEILQPAPGEMLGLGTNRIAGLAWAGENRLDRVEVSVDGGRRWHEARLIGLQERYCWYRWEFLWTAASPGEYRLCARAHADSGETQPLAYDPDNLGYIINVVQIRTVRVTAAQEARGTYADADRWLYDMAAYAEENTRRPLDIELSVADGGGI